MNTTPGTPATAARAAAEWWARQVVNPTFRQVRPNEEDRETLYGRGLAHIIANRHPVNDAQAEAFADALERIILRDTRKDDGYFHGLHVDYHPDRSLREAAEQAGVSTDRFPWKTNMWIHAEGHVTASLGYAAPEILIWTPDGWEHPACSSVRAEPKAGDRYDYVFMPEVCGLPRYHADGHGDWQPDTLLCARGDCARTRAEHYNATASEVGHAFDYANAVAGAR